MCVAEVVVGCLFGGRGKERGGDGAGVLCTLKRDLCEAA
jgi:hypothetical protein